MKELTKKAITGLIWLQIIMAVMLFAPAWTLHFWEAWAFWLLFSVLSTVITFYFLKHDPGLVESRLKAGPTAEHEKSQKIIQTLTAILWCALIIVPGIERHFHSSRIPAALVLLGDALVAVGYYIVFSRCGRTDGLPALSKCSRARVSFRPVPTASSATQCIRAVC